MIVKSSTTNKFTSSFFSPGTKLGGEGAGGFSLRTAIASIVGGTASKLGDGKFSNGAVSAAFVHMFNAGERLAYPSKENFLNGFTKESSRAYRALSMVARSQNFGVRGLSPLSYSQAYDRVLRIEAMNDNITNGLFLGAVSGSVLYDLVK